MSPRAAHCTCARRPDGFTAPVRAAQIALPPSSPGRHACAMRMKQGAVAMGSSDGDTPCRANLQDRP